MLTWVEYEKKITSKPGLGSDICLLFYLLLHHWNNIQSNLNSSNTDCSFTMAISNSFLSSFEILPIAQENKYLGKFYYFIVKLYVVVLIRIASSRRFYWVHSTYNYCVENRKDCPKRYLFAYWPCVMINPQWLELPISRTNFHGPKDVRATEVRLYVSSRLI